MKLLFCVVLSMLCVTLSSCKQPHPIKIEYMGEPCLIPVKNNIWKLCDNMIVHINDKYHAVPRGFQTDLASIPRPMWWLYSPTDFNSIASAVLHDWHYCCSTGIDRYEADNIFYNGLRTQGMGATRASIYYAGVRSMGWLFYTYGEGLSQHLSEFDKNELQGVYEDVNYRLG